MCRAQCRRRQPFLIDVPARLCKSLAGNKICPKCALNATFRLQVKNHSKVSGVLTLPGKRTSGLEPVGFFSPKRLLFVQFMVLPGDFPPLLVGGGSPFSVARALALPGHPKKGNSIVTQKRGKKPPSATRYSAPASLWTSRDNDRSVTPP